MAKAKYSIYWLTFPSTYEIAFTLVYPKTTDTASNGKVNSSVGIEPKAFAEKYKIA